MSNIELNIQYLISKIEEEENKIRKIIKKINKNNKHSWEIEGMNVSIL